MGSANKFGSSVFRIFESVQNCHFQFFEKVHFLKKILRKQWSRFYFTIVTAEWWR